MAQAVAEAAMQIRPIAQHVHLVHAHALESLSRGLDGVHDRDRLAIGDRHDEIGAAPDVVKYGIGNRWRR